MIPPQQYGPIVVSRRSSGKSGTVDKSRNPSSSIRSLSSSASASSSQRPRRRSSSYYRAATGNETTERGSSRSSMLELEFEFEFEETLTSTNAPPSEYDDDDDDDDINTNNNQDHKSLRHFLLVCVLGTFDDRIFFSAFVTGSSNNSSNRNVTQDTEQILFTRPTTIGVVVVVVVLFCN